MILSCIAWLLLKMCYTISNMKCPYCQQNSIKHGVFKPKDKKPKVQRYKCGSCHRTFKSYKHQFFLRLRVSYYEFDYAIKLCSQGRSIRSIAKQFKRRPNTVLEWVRRVKNSQIAYRDYLIKNHSYTNDQADEFIRNLFESLNVKV